MDLIHDWYFVFGLCLGLGTTAIAAGVIALLFIDSKPKKEKSDGKNVY